MGRKYNPEYRANLRARLAKPKCVCGKRVTSGMHKKCKKLLDKGMTYEEALREDAPLWLRLRLADDKYKHLKIYERHAQVTNDWFAASAQRFEELMNEPYADEDEADWLV